MTESTLSMTPEINHTAKKVVRVLALATNPKTGASTRFRILQWQARLAREGFSIELDAFFTIEQAATLYAPGHFLSKATAMFEGAKRRGETLARAAESADMLLIHREAFPLGRRKFWKELIHFPGPIVYDYDDAMFLPQRRDRGLLRQLEDTETPKELMKLSSVVLAGNRFLADYAAQYARRVVLLPTCIDTEQFMPRQHPIEEELPTVGWIGSHTTAKYLQSLIPVLERVARETPFRLYVVGSRQAVNVRGVEVRQEDWRLDREIEDFRSCTIGIYPLWADNWSKGKCGFKAIEFMACGVPVVASAIGANCEIMEDGVSGFLADTEDAWVDKLTQLLRDRALQRRMGQAGRHRIEIQYSLNAQAPNLVKALQVVSGSGGVR